MSNSRLHNLVILAKTVVKDNGYNTFLAKVTKKRTLLTQVLQNSYLFSSFTLKLFLGSAVMSLIIRMFLIIKTFQNLYSHLFRYVFYLLFMVLTSILMENVFFF